MWWICVDVSECVCVFMSECVDDTAGQSIWPIWHGKIWNWKAKITTCIQPCQPQLFFFTSAGKCSCHLSHLQELQKALQLLGLPNLQTGLKKNGQAFSSTIPNLRAPTRPTTLWSSNRMSFWRSSRTYLILNGTRASLNASSTVITSFLETSQPTCCCDSCQQAWFWIRFCSTPSKSSKLKTGGTRLKSAPKEFFFRSF